MDTNRTMAEPDKERTSELPPTLPRLHHGGRLSKTDSLEIAQQKMQEWMENGCRLGWLMDFKRKKAYIYRAGSEEVTITSFKEMLSGEDVLPEFTLALSKLR